MQLAPTLGRLIRPGGRLLLSGLLEAQGEEIRSAYSQWFDMEPAVNKDGWIRVTGVKR